MILWDSTNRGTAIRIVDKHGNVSYAAKPVVQVRKRKLTEAEDNAIGRAIRRKQNRLNRGWLPFAKR